MPVNAKGMPDRLQTNSIESVILSASFFKPLPC